MEAGVGALSPGTHILNGENWDLLPTNRMMGCHFGDNVTEDCNCCLAGRLSVDCPLAASGGSGHVGRPAEQGAGGSLQPKASEALRLLS